MPWKSRFSLVCLLSFLSGPGFGQENGTEWTQPAAYSPHAVTGQPLRGLKVAIDVGHNIASPGAGSARGVGEFYFNAETATTIRDVLTAAGARVLVINLDGKIAGLKERGTIANQALADCFISIHHDSVHQMYKKKWTFENRTLEYSDNFRGYSIFTSSKNKAAESSRALAMHVGEAFYETGMRPTHHHNEPIENENRPFLDKRTGVYEFTELGVVKAAEMPAILVECGVIVNRDEELLVKQEWYRRMIATSLVKALALSYQTGVIEASDPGGVPSPQAAVVPPAPAASLPPPADGEKKGGIRKFLPIFRKKNGE